jgi:sterol 14-demethylase
MRIVVDRDLCQGHGVCESEAPDVFEVGEDHQVVVLDPSPPQDQRAVVDAAVRFCPTHALSIADD